MSNYFIIFQVDGQAYLSLTERKEIVTFATVEEARASFESGYKNNHELGGSWSTSAALHWLNLKPFIVALPTSFNPLETIKVLTNQESPSLQVEQVSSAAVRTMNVIKVDLEACLARKVDQDIALYSSEWFKQETQNV